MEDAGAVFCWAFGCAMKSKSPPPPFKKGGEKHLIFLIVDDEIRPLEIPNKPPLFEGGLGGDLLSFRKTVLVATQGRFFVGHSVVRAIVGSDVL